MKVINEYAAHDNININSYFVEIMDNSLHKYKNRIYLSSFKELEAIRMILLQSKQDQNVLIIKLVI